MLSIKQKKHRRPYAIFAVAICLISTGVYFMMLTLSPSVAPLIFTKPIDAKSLPKAKIGENRIVIPRIGVNIHYDKGRAALDRGAEWRQPNHGNPKDGGNFIIAAHRFSIQPTPQGTVEKSPFYNIDKMKLGDNIVVDYEGARYAYEITKIFDVKPDQTEIEAPSQEAKLTLYSCELGGSDTGRIVITGKLLGQVEQ